MEHDYPLADLPKGQQGIVREIGLTGEVRRRMQDLGLVKDTLITCVGQSPMGDPKAYLIRGAVIALREQDSRQIMIEQIKQTKIE